MNDIIVMLPPPCTNNDLHMGHLAGVYIPGDVYARFMAMQGHKVYMVTGADQNNTYTQSKAKLTNIAFAEAKQYYADKIAQSMRAANIKLDAFVTTNSAVHQAAIEKIVKQLMQNNVAQIQRVNQPYCQYCNQYLCDAEVKGQCRFCFADSDGGICENCNSPIFNYNLLQAEHVLCNHRVVMAPSRVLTLNINKIRQPMQNLISRSNWGKRLKSKYGNYLDSENIASIPMTNHYLHGNSAGIRGVDAGYLAIWHEAIWCGITGLLLIYQFELPELIAHLSENQTQIVSFMGQDTEFYYAIALSATLLGLDVKDFYHRISVQRFIKLNGSKFSSSRNHLIYLRELLEDYPIDIIRLYCLSILNSYELD
ncbi:MAG: class I tRNA ligase family protein, partial [Gammaproteobacteria bacterium]|nr:class I tRNA ligase family protein [Gammaproteobacteria bacterium]